MPASFDPEFDFLVPADRVVAGTLCLMACYVQHRLPLYAERISSNLRVLALNCNVTGEMRALCGRLARRWDMIRAETAHRIALHGAPRDSRTLH